VRRRPGSELGLAGRWALLALYTALVYASLPYGPRIGRALSGSAFGNWLLGPGMALAVAVTGVVLLVRLVRRAAPWPAYVGLVLAAAGYTAALSWLRVQHLERIHLPEYGVAAWLAWWALVPLVPGPTSYVGAAVVAAAIGWGDELVQLVTPGRFYDLRDVAANALGAALGVILLAVVRSSRAAVNGESTARRSPQAGES
jgi:hypothetical protein